METVNDIATVVGLIRDVVLLLLLTVALIALLIIFGTIKRLLDSAKSTAETVNETVNTISEKVVEPMASNSNAMRGVGGLLGIIMGMRNKKKRKN